MTLHRVDDLQRQHAQIRHLVLIKGDVDALFALAIHDHIADAFDGVYFTLYIIGIVAKFLIIKTIRGHCIKQSEHVAKIVLYDALPCAVGQGRLQIVDFSAKIVPNLLHFLVGAGLGEFHGNHTHIVHTARRNIAHVLDLTDAFFEHVSNFEFHLIGRRAGIDRYDHRLLDGNLGILQFAHIVIRHHTAAHEHNQEERNEFAVVQRPRT